MNKRENFVEIKNIFCYNIDLVGTICLAHIRRKSQILYLLLKLLLESNEKELSDHRE